MRSFLPKLGSLLLMAALFGLGSSVHAKTVDVSLGGTMTTGGGGYYGGGTTTPILTFSPAQLTINVGDTVRFTSAGGAPHNVHADDNSFRCAKGCDGDGQGGNGTPSSTTWTSTVTFTKAGVVNYHCDQHQSMGMTGSITVNAVTAPAIALGNYLSGNWFNADQGGSGFQLEATSARDPATGLPVMLAIWFVYAPDGSGQNWIYAQGTYDPSKSSVTLPAIVTNGTKFPPNYVAGDVAASSWGTLTLSFADCNHGTASWNSTMNGYGHGSVAITRLTQIDGTTCPQ